MFIMGKKHASKCAEGQVNSDRVGIWVGVTKAQFVNVSIRTNFAFAKEWTKSFEWCSYLSGVATAKLWRHLTNMNVIFNYVTSV